MTAFATRPTPRADLESTRAGRPTILVNCRASRGPATGVRRYLAELLNLLGNDLSPILPGLPARGIGGHLWEQLLTPARAPGLLFSPANTGPIARREQVVTIHDVASLDHPEWFRPAFARWYRFLTPRLARTALRVLTVSEFSKDRIVHQTGVDPDRVTVIPNGVGHSFRPPDDRASAALRNRYRALRRDYLLYVGSLEPRKNLGRLFSAWEIARRSMPEVGLVVAGVAGRVFSGTGFGPPPAGVDFLGRVDDADLPALYGNALALVYPSLYEGFGLPPVEAMACGAAVIAPDAAWMPAEIREAALKVDPLDVDVIAEALRRVVEDAGLRASLRSLGLDRASRFSWERSAAETRAALDQAAATIRAR